MVDIITFLFIRKLVTLFVTVLLVFMSSTEEESESAQKLQILLKACDDIEATLKEKIEKNASLKEKICKLRSVLDTLKCSRNNNTEV